MLGDTTPYWGWHLVSQFVVAHFCRRNGFLASLARNFCKICLKGPFGKWSGLFWTHGMFWVCAQRLPSGMFPGRMGSSSLLQRQWIFSPLFLRRHSGHVLWLVCWVFSSCGVFSLELGGIPGLSGPRHPLWREEVSCSGNESTLGYEVHEHNSECRALEVIGQDWSSEVVADLKVGLSELKEQLCQTGKE